MEATVKIGDSLVNVTCLELPHAPEAHGISHIDVWDRTVRVVRVESESQAILALLDFLNINGPGPAWLALFGEG